MHGHWSGNTRKLNKHYQSGNARFDDYVKFDYSGSVRFAMDRVKGLYICISNCDYRKDTFSYVDDYVPVCIIPESVMHFGSINVTTLDLADSGFNAGAIDTRVNVQAIDVYDNWGNKITKDCLVIAVNKKHFRGTGPYLNGVRTDIDLKNNIKNPFEDENYFAIRFFGLGYIEDEIEHWSMLYKDVQSYGAINEGPDVFVSTGDDPYIEGVGPINIPSYTPTSGAILHIGGNIHIPGYKNSVPNGVYRELWSSSDRIVSRLVSPHFETVYRSNDGHGGLDNRCFDLADIILKADAAKTLTNYKESW